MRRFPLDRTLAALAAFAALTLLAGAPRAAAQAPAAPATVAAPHGARRVNEADVRFMQGMIGHHAQALAMSALVPARTERPEMRLLAERIDVSQRDEIAMMREWLEARGIAAPDSGAGHDHHAAMGHAPAMPGMLTAEELAALGAATGVAFERLFLTSMIRHHQGALTMVSTLFGSSGGGQDPDVFRLASDVDADQRAEISRMRALLAARAARGAP